MKHSIKWKLTISFIIVMVCLIGSILLFNTLFLEKIYVNQKKSIIKQSYYALENGITEAYDMGFTLSDLFKKKRNITNGTNESNLSMFLRELQEVYGVMVILMDSDNKIYSLYQNNSRFDTRMKDYIYRDITNDENIKILEKTNLYTIAISEIVIERNQKIDSAISGGPSEFYENPGPGQIGASSENRKKPNVSILKSSNLECFGFLSDNETVFFITIPVESIKEPIELFNKALVVVSFITIIIGSIIIFFISNNFSMPLLQLSELSKKMSRLEFENKYEGREQDEIGVLGNSMNNLSQKLEKAIGELKNANVKLKQDLEQKEQLDMLRQEFVANVSHELKTPIALIQGYAEGLELDEIVNSKEKKDYYVSVIKDETQKMNKLVHQLLDLSELERGITELDISRVNLKEIVDGVCNNYKLKLDENNISLNISIDEDIFVWADGYKIEEVIRNYISNAINHVDENKSIKVYVKEVDEKIRLCVFNSGIQLSNEEMTKIWDKFYKVDKSHTRTYGGTGLGLSIVKAIAIQHNTTCGCENIDISNIKGMEFYFDLFTK